MVAGRGLDQDCFGDLRQQGDEVVGIHGPVDRLAGRIAELQPVEERYLGRGVSQSDFDASVREITPNDFDCHLGHILQRFKTRGARTRDGLRPIVGIGGTPVKIL